MDAEIIHLSLINYQNPLFAEKAGRQKWWADSIVYVLMKGNFSKNKRTDILNISNNLQDKVTWKWYDGTFELTDNLAVMEIKSFFAGVVALESTWEATHCYSKRYVIRNHGNLVLNKEYEFQHQQNKLSKKRKELSSMVHGCTNLLLQRVYFEDNSIKWPWVQKPMSW
jgi:hypothetical protein